MLENYLMVGGIIIAFILWTIEGVMWSVANLQKYKAKAHAGSMWAFWIFILRGGPYTIGIAIFLMPLLIVNSIKFIFKGKTNDFN